MEQKQEWEAQVSTAKQVRDLALARLQHEAAAGECEQVTLPSGLVFMMRRPRPLWWALEGRLPSSMAAQLASDRHSAMRYGSEDRAPEETAELSRWLVALLAECVAAPKIRLNPEAGEVDPNWLSDEDALFILKYAGGGAMADGRSLDRFPQVGQSAAAGAGGRHLEMPSEPDAGDQQRK